MQKLLLVDADADSRTVYRLLLQHAGYEVLEALNGPDALATARATPPDLIITETALPGMDGLTLLESVHQEPALENTRLCVLTATVSEQIDERCRELRVCRVLVKPLQPSALLEEVGRILSGAPSGG
ncbi:MAG: response regulator [Gemmatimonadota bacterium]